MKDLAPNPWTAAQPTGQSLKLGWGYGLGCVRVGGHPSPTPEGASNLQPVLHHAGVVSAQNWSTGERLCGGVANALAEELEPLWLAALLFRVPEAFGCYISLQSTRSACRLTALGRTDLRCQGQSSGQE